MKLHKLLYFTQRKSITLTNEPMFPEHYDSVWDMYYDEFDDAEVI